MMFVSKPHEIEAFQFANSEVKPPGWFTDAFRARRDKKHKARR